MNARAISVRAATFLGVIALFFATAIVVSPLASAATITQAPPTSTSVTVANSNGFTDQLNVSGNSGSVTYTQTTSDSTHLNVDASGQVTVNATLPVGSYNVVGTDSDTNLNSGSWSYTLTVTASTITQISPTGASVTAASSNGFTDQLNVSGNSGSVTYTQTASNSTHLSVNATGQVKVNAILAVGTYTVSGANTDPFGDTGHWSYTLGVTGTTITQTSPTGAGVTVANSNGFSDQLNVSGNTGSVTYTQTASDSTHLSVNAAGQVKVNATLAVGTYTVSGTDHDSVNDTGTWTYTLTVNADAINHTTIVQTSPTSGVTSSTASAAFQPPPLAVNNNTGAVTFTVQGTSTGLKLSGNQISTTGNLSAGHYTISGTDSDASGDTGVWSYTLTVTSVLTQTSPSSGVTTTAASSTFDPGSLAVANSTGAVTFVTTVSSAGLNVTSGGVITTTGKLAAGSYTVSGTDSDAGGGTGSWTYTLHVNQLATTVTFDPNRGRGTMAPERHNAPTALTINKFTRPGYTFANWTTKANGSGRSYANGDLYPFTSSVTLYAQWRKGKAVTRSVAFNANGGSGAMAVERDSTPTGLTGNRFTRAKFTFVDWNTSPNGSGASYPNGAIYPFNRSVTLYAQWRAVKISAFTVTFNAHGGSGAMTAERHNAPAALTNNQFRRPGYAFLYWSTAANGSGARYANGGPYPFTSSITLYAQWRRYKVAVKPAIPASGAVGPFALKSYALFPALQSQIDKIANTVKTNRDTRILLVGYGDKLSAADARNESLWAANIMLSQHRDGAVEAYLKQRLAALGVENYTIVAQENGAITPSTTANQRNDGLVMATLT